MVIKGIVCIILCPVFLWKNMAYYYSNELLSAILLQYILKLKRNISNICSDDSVANDY